MRWILFNVLPVMVSGNFTTTLLRAREKFPYDVLDLFLCPAPNCHYSWRMQFTQLYRNSACVDMIPHGRTQFIIDIDHQCRYEMANQTFDATCDEMATWPPVDIMGFKNCWSASPRKTFTEECSNVCKHGRPVSRCVYTVDPEGDYALADTLEGCHLNGLCLCRDPQLKHCDLEARFIECYRTEEALARLEAEAELAQLHKSLGENASLGDKYSALEHAYDQRTAEFNDLEEEHEEVSEQLDHALAELQSQRDKHRAEVASRSPYVDDGAEIDSGIIAKERLGEVQVKLDKEIRARKAKEAELKKAKRTNTRLILLLSVALLAVFGALSTAYYFMKRKPRVLFVGATPEGEGTNSDETAVRNSTVVMGREIPASDAKASSTV
jgi:hypothetical protein